jgi:hypothetical protein
LMVWLMGLQNTPTVRFARNFLQWNIWLFLPLFRVSIP